MAELTWTFDMTTERQWYVVYTKPNTEKKFAEQVERLQSDCEVFLPLITQTRKWSDRNKTISTVLFKSYVFVYLDGNEFQHIKRMAGFVNYVRFNNRPATIAYEQITLIKRSLNTGYDISVLANRLIKGARVEIIAGSLQGYEGTLMELNSKHVVAVEVHGLEQSMLVSVPIELIKLVGEAHYG
ncbi:UpxY family transcription antiterminator [Pseudoalteromonas sp. MMG012]|uniref:UpxY family transcription antiterminator n=1 Tax=Pseudoalteromonas sp. MMG012 TaxID=2822686 RepID=UPI00289F75E7|nr:UpxY family transcription antiterminator [Pseudoalteromonas sp. MMG012]